MKTVVFRFFEPNEGKCYYYSFYLYSGQINYLTCTGGTFFRKTTSTIFEFKKGYLSPPTQTASTLIGLNHPRSSAQTVRNFLREAYLHARRPHSSLHRLQIGDKQLEWASAHI